MLTGMCSSSSGSAAIFGYDINDPDQMAEIRKMTGICPQHDILFDEITPREHLTYFARIRASSRIRTKKQKIHSSQGLEEHQVVGEVEAILKDTDLEEKADTQVAIRPKMMSVIHTQTSVLIIFHHPANREIRCNNI